MRVCREREGVGRDEGGGGRRVGLGAGEGGVRGWVVGLGEGRVGVVVRGRWGKVGGAGREGESGGGREGEGRRDRMGWEEGGDGREGEGGGWRRMGGEKDILREGGKAAKIYTISFHLSMPYCLECIDPPDLPP